MHLSLFSYPTANIFSKILIIAVQTAAMSDEILDDMVLFRRIAREDEQAFERIFYKYLPVLKPFLLGFVKVEAIADELLQDLFLKVWLGRANLSHVKNPSAWLYKVASNLALDHLRHQATEYRVIKENLISEGESTNGLFEHLSAKQLREIIHEAVESLPEQRKRIYKLTRESGWSHKKVAEHLDISVQTVKNQVVNAVKAIQAHIRQSTGTYIPLILISTEINFFFS